MAKQNWLEKLKLWLPQQNQTRTMFLQFPVYRPDLVADMAAKLRYYLLDYRKTYLLPLGWAASKVPLSALAEAVRVEIPLHPGVVLQNSEALLALHSSAARQDWFMSLVHETWAQPVLLPLVLYAHELASSEVQIFKFEAHELPEETLIDRLQTFQ